MPSSCLGRPLASSPTLTTGSSRRPSPLRLARMTCTPLLAYNVAHQPSNGAARPSLQGTWLKDPASSDLQAMSRAMDAMRIGGIQKHCALNLMRGLQIVPGPNGDELEVAHLTPSWVMKHFSLSERFAAGRETKMSRRDMRRGEQRAVALALAPDHLHVDISWQGQLPGRVEERYTINSTGQLEVHSVMQIEGQPAIPIRMVYNRAEGKVHIEG